MKIRTVGRHIRESFKSLARNGWMTFASVSAVMITLLLVGVFFVLMMNMAKVADDLENDVEIKAYIDLTVEKEGQEKLLNQISSLSLADSVEFSSKDEELDNLIQDLGQQYALFEQTNPLYDTFIVKAASPKDTGRLAVQIERIEGISSTEYGKTAVEPLFNFLEVSRNVGLALIVGLLFTAAFLISNTIKITIFARRREIEIMKLVGATNWFIRWPFVIEGFLLGVIGAIVPVLAVSVGYQYVYGLVSPKLQGNFIKILEVTPVAVQVSTLLFLMGGLIGVWGSTMSIRKFLRV
ncbi:permease-like cell division protein FtsX [Mangrovibacillus cuniculi]|uniref:Cell division protein FtsX n=1 Tax=Mangrovibacillus cuniculi TaxID=2593652 RepID=A0A7S8CCN6_9BACI|nr:permease-like cell division protein FtsX [Mangrovibacillus cuniculi]QPC47487.1 ABC transporter permease [Mangrovibacillus cuniculi]